MSYLNPYADEAEEYSEDNYIVRHWKGHLPLAIAYWINGGILFAVTGFAINLILMAAAEAADSLQALAALSVLGILILIVMRIWSFVGIWRSAGRHTARGGSQFWSVVARMMVGLGLLSSAVQAQNAYLQLQEFAQIAVGSDPIGARATFRLGEGGTDLIMEGLLTEGTAGDFEQALASAPQVRKIILNSEGGRIFEAERIAKLIQGRGLATHVEEQCSSACTLILLAGESRTAGLEAAIGFHRVSFPGMIGAEDDQANASLARSYAAAGLPADFTRRVAATPPEDLWVPEVVQLMSAKVLTDATVQVEHLLAGSIAHWKPRLPMRVDEVTTLVNVSARDGALIYDYRVAAPAAAVDAAAFSRDLGRGLQAQNCGDDAARELLELGGSFEYSYRGNGGEEIATIPITACPRQLAPQRY